MRTLNLKALTLTTAMAAVLFSSPLLAADTATVPVNVTVQNAITLTNVDPLDFGSIIAINDAVETATVTVATNDGITFGTTGAPALTAAAGGTPTAGEITSAGVVGATINMTLNSVVDPTDGTSTLVLSAFNRDVNGGGSTATTPGTPFTYTATALDTILIGATITTPASGTQIGDGAYVGSFDLVASY